MGGKRSSYSKVRKGVSYAQTAVQALRIAKSAAAALNSETKVYNSAVLSGGISQTGSVAVMFAPPQGVQDSQREGDQVKATYLESRIEFNAIGAGPDATVRMIWFWEKEYTGTTIIAGMGGKNLLHDAANPAINFLAPMNRTNRKDYTIISDQIFSLDSTGGNSKVFVIKKKLNKKCSFDPQTTTPNGNALMLALCSSEAINFPLILGQTKIHYVDN